MTTGGEGGMFVTNNKTTWEKAWSYKDHGKNYDSIFNDKHSSGFRWFVQSFGTNFRMTEMQAAMGRIMLSKLDMWVERRRYFADLLNQAFNNIPGLRTTIPSLNTYHAYYKYYVFICPEKLKIGYTQKTILAQLSEKRVPCVAGICPEVYLEKAFERYPYRLVPLDKKIFKDDQNMQHLPNAKKLGENSLMFMVHPTLDVKSVRFVISQVRAIMENACK